MITKREYLAVVRIHSGDRGRPRHLWVGWDTTYGESYAMSEDNKRAIRFESRDAALAAAHQFTIYGLPGYQEIVSSEELGPVRGPGIQR